MITVSKEDYLKSILEAETEGETVISARLAHLLKVSPPAVTMALRRLKKDGLVRVEASGEVRLTADGRKIARKLTLRHHLIERMLSARCCSLRDCSVLRKVVVGIRSLDMEKTDGSAG